MIRGWMELESGLSACIRSSLLILPCPHSKRLMTRARTKVSHKSKTLV